MGTTKRMRIILRMQQHIMVLEADFRIERSPELFELTQKVNMFITHHNQLVKCEFEGMKKIVSRAVKENSQGRGLPLPKRLKL